MSLSHRERVRIALNHQEPDRVPTDLCGSTCNVVDPLYFKVKEMLGIKGDIKPYRSGKTCNYYDERVLQALDTDFRHIWLGAPKSFKAIRYDDGSFIDEWGAHMKKVGNFVEPVEPTIKEPTMDALEKHTWPDTEDVSRVDGLKERASYLYHNTDYAISAKFVSSGGFLEHGGWLRGFENWLMDLTLNEEFANALCDKILEVKLKLYEMMLREVGDYIDMVEIAEDFGTQGGLLISPNMFRKYMKPRYKKIIDRIKELAPNVKVFFHTCGSVRPIIQDFIDIGVDVLNPLQPLATGMDPGEIKSQYGDKLSFHGAVDIQEALPGTIDDVREEVNTRLRQLAKGGGYILAPTNHVQYDTPPENLISLYKFAHEYGKYPIKL